MLQRTFLSVLLLITTSLPAWCQPLSVASRFDSIYTGYFRLNSGGWTAGDATISVPLPDGRVIWLFGDSYTVAVNTSNNTLPCLFQVRNCFMVQDSANPASFKTILDTTMTGVNRTTFKLRPNDTSIFWPGHGYVYGDTVYIFLERYKNSNLKYEGCYIAKLTYPELHQVSISPAFTGWDDRIFGRAVLPDTTSNLLYIYGNRLNWIVWEPVLARCNIANPLSPWEFFNGKGWSPNPGLLQKLSADPVSPGFSVFRKNNMYYLITQENGYLECGLGREIWSYHSAQPQGPFTGKTLLYTEESMFNGAYLLTYNAQAHPWNMENDELLVCYNLNDRVDTAAPYVCPSQCVDIWTDRLDADTYRPKFIRVPMGLITSGGSGLAGPAGSFIVKIIGQPVVSGGTFRAEIRSGTSRCVTIRLVQSDGRVLWNQSAPLVQEKQLLDLPCPGSAGIYLLEFTDDDGCRTVDRLMVR